MCSSDLDLAVATLRQSPAFVLAETPAEVRSWVEQYQSSNAATPLRLVLLSSASASAVSSAYASSGSKRITGPLVGLRDAIVYKAVRQPGGGTTLDKVDQRWNSIGLGTLVATLIILLGTAINMVRNVQRRVRR